MTHPNSSRDAASEAEPAPESPGAIQHRRRRRLATAQAFLDDDADSQHSKVSEGFCRRMSDAHPQAALLRDITRSLVAAGFVLHDCAFMAIAGGVCLTPLSSHDGVLVTWSCHDALALDPAMAPAQCRVQGVMDQALADVLDATGWQVRDYGTGAAAVVTGRKHPGVADRQSTSFDVQDRS